MRELAQEVDLILVVGAPNSLELQSPDARSAEELGVASYLIETPIS